MKPWKNIVKGIKRRLHRNYYLYHPNFTSMLFKAYRGKIPSRGFVFDINTPHFYRGNTASLFWSTYESREIEQIRKFLRRDLDVIEFGSGIGAISLEIIRVQQPTRRLICVEANPHLIPTLEKNLQRNAPDKKVVVLNQALDYSGNGEVGLMLARNNLSSKITEGKEANNIFVKAGTLTELLKDQQIEEFALTCDIEGAEAGIIMDDAEALAKCRQIFIELHATTYKGQPYSEDELRQKIEAHGFRLIIEQLRVYAFERIE